jgi:hypothetical protein
MANQQKQRGYIEPKWAESRIPAPQQQRIVKRFISGQGIRQIAREESRSRGAVVRIVRSSEVQNYVLEMREAYYGLAVEALEALRRALRSSKDGKIAHQLLADVEVIPGPDQRPRPEVAQDDEEKQVQQWTAKLVRMGIARSLAYGGGQIEEDLEKVGGRLNRKTGKIEPIRTVN